MKYLLIFFVGVILLSSCSPKLSRYNYRKPNPIVKPECNVTFVYTNIGLEAFQPIGKAGFSDNGFNTNCSQKAILDLFENEACNLGANLIYIYDIRMPDLISTCFRAKVEFYRVDESIKNKIFKNDGAGIDSSSGVNKKNDMVIQYKTIKTIDTLDPNKAVHSIELDLGLGALLSGVRKDIVMEGLDPDPDNITSYGIGGGYSYLKKKIGYDVRFNYSVSKAIKKDYDPFSIYNDVLFSLGLAVIPFEYSNFSTLNKFYLKGGFNYDIMSFSEKTELDFVGSATGFGYYLLAGFDFLNLSNKVLWGMSLEYNYLDVRFPNASSNIFGNYLIFKMKFGRAFY